MPGNILTFDLALAVRKQAAVEKDRITAILGAIDELKASEGALKDDTLSEAGECLALDRLTEAENKLLALIVDPGFARYQQALQRCLSEFVEGAA